MSVFEMNNPVNYSIIMHKHQQTTEDGAQAVCISCDLQTSELNSHCKPFHEFWQ